MVFHTNPDFVEKHNSKRRCSISTKDCRGEVWGANKPELIKRARIQYNLDPPINLCDQHRWQLRVWNETCELCKLQTNEKTRTVGAELQGQMSFHSQTFVHRSCEIVALSNASGQTALRQTKEELSAKVRDFETTVRDLNQALQEHEKKRAELKEMEENIQQITSQFNQQTNVILNLQASEKKSQETIDHLRKEVAKLKRQKRERAAREWKQKRKEQEESIVVDERAIYDQIRMNISYKAMEMFYKGKLRRITVVKANLLKTLGNKLHFKATEYTASLSLTDLLTNILPSYQERMSQSSDNLLRIGIDGVRVEKKLMLTCVVLTLPFLEDESFEDVRFVLKDRNKNKNYNHKWNFFPLNTGACVPSGFDNRKGRQQSSEKCTDSRFKVYL